MIGLFRKKKKLEVDPRIEMALKQEQGQLRDNITALQSSTRVLQNMAGAMQLMALAGRLHDSENGRS